ncbi:MAG TPA: ABC transporter ATP-binding protein [Nitrososphaerales archaeon]|nr:ABC transporter ATP-binding protein [Nitrososphaerales archaeon]
MSQSHAQGGGNEDVLSIRELKLKFHTYAGEVSALDGISLSIKKGELLGLVGESGCGKSVTALAIAGLLPQNAEITNGDVILDGKNMLTLEPEEMRLARLKDIAMIFQDPMTYLNPVFTIGSQMVEITQAEPKLFVSTLVAHRLRQIDKEAKGGEQGPKLLAERENLAESLRTQRLGRRELNELTKSYSISLLRSVRLPEPEKVFEMYPFELSGGMRQRVMIAMAMMRRPKLLLADEITTALDVTVQAQILHLMKELRSEINSSVLLITHDLAIVSEVCDRVAVMYAGNIVEIADVQELFRNPLHPYTKGLLASVPRADVDKIPDSIEGSVPDLLFPPGGCRFNPRCPKAFDVCPSKKPSLIEAVPNHYVSCFLYGG